MKVIFDNIIFSLQSQGGISVYWRELLKRAEKNLDSFEINYSTLSSRQINLHTGNSMVRRKRWGELLYRLVLPENDANLFHPSYYRLIDKSSNSKLKKVITLHDFTHEKMVPLYRSYPLIKLKKKALIEADQIICVSQNTINDLLEFYPEIESSRINLVYNGVSEEYRIDVKENELRASFPSLNKFEFLLFIGSRALYKNFQFACEIANNFPKLKLVIVGNDLTKEEKSHLKYLDNVIVYKNLKESDLNLLYHFSTCLLYPSSYEGFGIPIVESWYSGGISIALNTSSIPEVKGPNTFLLESLDLDYACDIIISILKNRPEEVIADDKKFSWDKTYNETVKVYIKTTN